MEKERKVSVVMCTYNGQRYLREQLDSILRQNYEPYEIIVQDDGSTDGTMDILREYARLHPRFKVSVNKGARGINSNFFSAMDSATGDFIAISDQDDIWQADKIEAQMDAIGDKMMCVCRSIPFSDSTGKDMPYDARRPNCDLIRLLYASMPGHCMLLSRRLLEQVPRTGEIYNQTWYDVILGLTAAALDSVVLLDKFLVRQRRQEKAASYTVSDKRRNRSMGNGLYIIAWSLRNYRGVKGPLSERFKARHDFLLAIKSDADIYKDGLKVCEYESRKGLMAMLKLIRMHLKYRHTMFFTYERDPIAIVRAVLFPLMQVYNYRHLKKVDN